MTSFRIWCVATFCQCKWWFFSGVLLGIGFTVPALWFVSVFGVLFFIHASITSAKKGERFLGGMVAGTVTALGSLFWYFSVYPVSWLPLEVGLGQLPVIFICWLISAVALSFGSGFLAVVFGHYFSKSQWWLLALPFLWVGAEVVNSFTFSLVTIGPAISPNSHFSFSYLGYHLAQSPIFFFAAAIGGVYALSFLGAALGAMMYYWWQRRLGWQELVAGYLVLVFVGWFLPQVGHTPSQAIRVAVIDTYFDETFLRGEDATAQKQAILRTAIEKAQTAFPAYILLPEDSRFTPADIPAQSVYPWFRFGRSATDVVVIDSGVTRTSGVEQILRGTIIDGKKATAYQLDKQYLVPQGEFVPYASRALFHGIGLGSFIDTMRAARTFIPGPLQAQEDFPTHLPAIIFCFESVSPVGVRLAIGDRTVPFVAHPFSHTWFNTPTGLWHQLDTMLRIQARWNNISIISAGNMGAGALYTKEGVKVELPVYEEGERYRVRLVNL